MLTTGQLRILTRDFIRKITRPTIVQDADIRYLKSGNGVFPKKYVWFGESNNLQFKESPFLPDDIFILFDVLQLPNKAAELVNDKIQSSLPLQVIINIYGEACEDELQYLRATLHRYDVKLWLQKNKLTLEWVPEDFQILDGRENATWWKRRRIELKLIAQQEVEYYGDDDTYDDIESIKRNTTIRR